MCAYMAFPMYAPLAFYFQCLQKHEAVIVIMSNKSCNGDIFDNVTTIWNTSHASLCLAFELSPLKHIKVAFYIWPCNFVTPSRSGNFLPLISFIAYISYGSR